MIISNVTNKTEGYVFTDLSTRTDTVSNSTDMMKIFEDVDQGNGAMSSTSVNKGLIVSGSDTVAALEENLKAKAELAKANLTTLFNKLSTMDAEAISESEDINDIEVDKMVSVVEEIKIMLATYCENYIPFGDIDVEAIKEVVGSTSLAMSVINKLNSAALPVTKDNVKDVMTAKENLDSIKEVTAQAKAYLIKNELSADVDNVYKAVHSANNYAVKADKGQGFETIKTQVENMLKDNQYANVDKGMDTAKWLYANDIDLTIKNIERYDVLETVKCEYTEDEALDLLVDALKYNGGATKALMTEERSAAKKAADAIKTLNSASFEDVAAIAKSGEPFNILSIRRVQEISVRAIEIDKNNEISISYYRKLEETRLMMTSKSAMALIEKGIDIDVEELSNLVENLKELEMAEYKASYEEVDKSLELRQSFSQLAQMPVYAIGAVKEVFSATGNELLQAGKQVRLKLAAAAYETMRTEVRPDLKDSVQKAVDNSVDAILAELNMVKSKANVRAVSVLAYNEMEMSIENIMQVKNMDSMLNNLFENMTPEVALSIVRDKKNPMDVEISELNDYIEDLGIETKGKKFSQFLYELDKNDSLTPEERNDYIGIYKMFNSLKSDSMNAIGALIKQGGDFTLENLMAMYQSMKDKGMDISLTDEKEFRTSADTAFYRKLFTRVRENINVDTLSGTDNLMNRNLELLADELEEYDASSINEEYYREQLNNLAKAKDMETDIIRILTDNEQAVTINNLYAAYDIKNKKIFEKLANVTDYELINEALEEGKNLKEAYEKIDNKVKEYVENASNDKTNSLEFITLKRMSGITGIINGMAKKNHFVVPAKINGKLVDIDLKLIYDSEEKGRLSINYVSEKYSKIGIECNVNATGVDAYIFSNTDVDVLANDIKNNILSLGYEECNIKKVSLDEEVSIFGDTNEKVLGSKLYELAKTIIAAIQ